MSAPDPIIGIDLGTTNSTVATVDGQGQPQILTDAKGHRSQPSVVSFTPNGAVIVGAQARQRRVGDPANTIYSAKRLLGRPFATEEVRRVAERVAYQIKQGTNQQPVVVTRGGEFAIAEISAIVLDHMRGLAEEQLQQPVNRAVVAVPAQFTEAQRSATTTAGSIAGIDIVQIINEPTAAALAYGHQHQLERLVAVYDFGGGTFDITILQVRDSVYEVLATAGAPLLGGDDVDHALVGAMVEHFRGESGMDLRQTPRAVERLAIMAEQVKIELSRRTRAVVQVEEITRMPGGQGLDFSMRLTRDMLEDHARPFIDHSFQVCADALKQAGIQAQAVEDVILVGGMTHMPLIQQRVAQFFGRAPRTDIDPGEAVATGAALRAEELRLAGGRRKRRDTTRGPVVPPAPPMEARMPLDRPENGPWESGATLPRTMPWDIAKAPEPPLAQGPLAILDSAANGNDGGQGGGQGGGQRGGQSERERAGGSERDGALEVSAGFRQPQKGGREIIELSGGAIGTWALPKNGRQSGAGTGVDADTASPSPSSPGARAGAAGSGEIGQRGDQVSTRSLRPPGTGEREPGGPASGSSGSPSGSSASSSPSLSSLSGSAYRHLETSPSVPLSPASGPTSGPSLGKTRRAESMLPSEGLFDEFGEFTHPGSAPIRPPSNVTPTGHGAGGRAASQAAAVQLGPQTAADLANKAAAARATASTILDVFPHSLGIGTVSGYCRRLLRRNARLPAHIQEIFTTSKDNQDVVRIRVYQGESQRIHDNVVLGDLVLDKIEPRPRGKTRIAVLIHVDESGMLHVRARDEITGREQNAELQVAGLPSAKEIESATARFRALRERGK